MVHRLQSPFAEFLSGKIWRCSGLGPGTLAFWQGYGAGNPRLFVSGRFTSLVNCGELVNPLNSLGELDY